MVEKIREEGEKWVIKQGEGIFIYLFLSPLNTGKQTDYPSRRTICLVLLPRRTKQIVRLGG